MANTQDAGREEENGENVQPYGLFETLDRDRFYPTLNSGLDAGLEASSESS